MQKVVHLAPLSPKQIKTNILLKKQQRKVWGGQEAHWGVGYRAMILSIVMGAA